MTGLASEQCSKDIDQKARLDPHDIRHLEGELPPGWKVVENHHLFKSFSFDDFSSALEFVNQIGAVAETEQHHPDIGLSYGTVDVTVVTHKVGGLTRNDFVLAAKISSLSQDIPTT
jgi:4a-hydroxytetrahydrobiopterin dehydratase